MSDDESGADSDATVVNPEQANGGDYLSSEEYLTAHEGHPDGYDDTGSGSESEGISFGSDIAEGSSGFVSGLLGALASSSKNLFNRVQDARGKSGTLNFGSQFIRKVNRSTNKVRKATDQLETKLNETGKDFNHSKYNNIRKVWKLVDELGKAEENLGDAVDETIELSRRLAIKRESQQLPIKLQPRTTIRLIPMDLSTKSAKDALSEIRATIGNSLDNISKLYIVGVDNEKMRNEFRMEIGQTSAYNRFAIDGSKDPRTLMSRIRGIGPTGLVILIVDPSPITTLDPIMAYGSDFTKLTNVQTVLYMCALIASIYATDAGQDDFLSKRSVGEKLVELFVEGPTSSKREWMTTPTGVEIPNGRIVSLV